MHKVRRWTVLVSNMPQAACLHWHRGLRGLESDCILLATCHIKRLFFTAANPASYICPLEGDLDQEANAALNMDVFLSDFACTREIFQFSPRPVCTFLNGISTCLQARTDVSNTMQRLPPSFCGGTLCLPITQIITCRHVVATPAPHTTPSCVSLVSHAGALYILEVCSTTTSLCPSLGLSSSIFTNNSALGGGGGALFLYTASPQLLDVNCLPNSNVSTPTTQLTSACPTLWSSNSASYGPLIATTAQSVILDSPETLQAYRSNTPMNVSVRILDFYNQTISGEHACHLHVGGEDWTNIKSCCVKARNSQTHSTMIVILLKLRRKVPALSQKSTPRKSYKAGLHFLQGTVWFGKSQCHKAITCVVLNVQNAFVAQKHSSHGRSYNADRSDKHSTHTIKPIALHTSRKGGTSRIGHAQARSRKASLLLLGVGSGVTDEHVTHCSTECQHQHKKCSAYHAHAQDSTLTALASAT